MPTAATPGSRRVRLGVGGSLTNRLAEAAAQPSVNVGDGATIIMYSDRHACTVIEASEKRVTVQRDKATRTDNNGICDSQSYSYERDPNGATRTARPRHLRFARMANGFRSARAARARVTRSPSATATSTTTSDSNRRHARRSITKAPECIEVLTSYAPGLSSPSAQRLGPRLYLRGFVRALLRAV